MSSDSQLSQSGIGRLQSGTAGHGLVRHCPALPIGRNGTKVRDVIFMASSIGELSSPKKKHFFVTWLTTYIL
jgi:hypothetical protein